MSEANNVTHSGDDEGKTPIVICARCKREHEGFTHDQADGCAADISAKGIYGHYGSAEADMTEMHFTPDHPDVPKGLEGGQMCDLCIIELRDKGALVEFKFCGPSCDGANSRRREAFSETAHLVKLMDTDQDQS